MKKNNKNWGKYGGCQRVHSFVALLRMFIALLEEITGPLPSQATDRMLNLEYNFKGVNISQNTIHALSIYSAHIINRCIGITLSNWLSDSYIKILRTSQKPCSIKNVQFYRSRNKKRQNNSKNPTQVSWG